MLYGLKTFEHYVSDSLCRRIFKDYAALFFERDKTVVKPVVFDVGYGRIVQRVILI